MLQESVIQEYLIRTHRCWQRETVRQFWSVPAALVRASRECRSLASLRAFCPPVLDKAWVNSSQRAHLRTGWMASFYTPFHGKECALSLAQHPEGVDATGASTATVTQAQRATRLYYLHAPMMMWASLLELECVLTQGLAHHSSHQIPMPLHLLLVRRLSLIHNYLLARCLDMKWRVSW